MECKSIDCTLAIGEREHLDPGSIIAESEFGAIILVMFKPNNSKSGSNPKPRLVMSLRLGVASRGWFPSYGWLGPCWVGR